MKTTLSYFKILFDFFNKYVLFLKKQVTPFLTVAGVMFLSLICVAVVLFKLSEKINFLKLLSFYAFSLSFIFLVILIPIANIKIGKSLTIISHKSYFYFIFFIGLFVWLILSETIKFFPSIDYTKIFIDNTVNIIITIYAFLTIAWFSYHLVYTNELSKLRKNLQIYIVLITFFQLFVLKKYMNFDYCISILVITYTFIQYLFESKNLEMENNKKIL
ncbi:hypothetical protein [Treponema denticola]|uniref:hypothetical protein n=1 Tax=Treponema denticola TaxID=158 RepID=UPI0020A3D2F6|nr:hypothetical protein [Treponema denticola]UTC83991.1 hypothetical protein HGJ18_12640 [Treponema denticola]